MRVAPLAGPLASNVIEVEIPSDVFFGGVVTFFVVVVVAILGALMWQLARTFSRRRMDDDLARWAQRYNLVIADELVEPLNRYLTLRTRGGLIGLLVVAGPIMTAMLVSLSDSDTPFGVATSIAMFGAIWTSSFVGSLIGGAFGRRAAADAGRSTRTARITALPLSSLVDPLESRLARLSALVSVPLTVLVFALSRAPWTNGRDVVGGMGLGPLAALSVAGAVITLAVPSFTARAQRARALSGDDNALAWSDALTSRSIRDLLAIGFVLTGGSGLIGLVSIGATFPADWRTASLVALNAAAPLGIVLLVAVTVVIAVRSPERHVQRTLWPQFALNPNLDRPSRYSEVSAEADAAGASATRDEPTADAEHRRDAQ